MAKMVTIDRLIKHLKKIRRKYGNECVYIRDASWGDTARKRQMEDRFKNLKRRNTDVH